MIIAEIDIREKPAGEEVETAFWEPCPCVLKRRHRRGGPCTHAAILHGSGGYLSRR
jgi:hypothetical protein